MKNIIIFYLFFNLLILSAFPQHPKVESLIQKLSTYNANDKRINEILLQLEKLSTEDVRNIISKELSSSKKEIQRSCLFILHKLHLKSYINISDKIFLLTKDNDQIIRGMSALVLGRIQDNKSYELLVSKLANDESFYVRRCVSYALGNFKSKRKEIISILMKMKDDPNESVRNNAYASLLKLNKNANENK